MVLTRIEVAEPKYGMIVAFFPDDPEGLAEANEHAERIGGMVMVAEYEYSDSQMIRDYRPPRRDDNG